MQATTGSLLVGITSLAGAITAYRSGNVLLTRDIVFGAVAIGGAAAGAKASGLVSAPALLAAFAALLLVVAGVMAARQLRSRRGRPGVHLASNAGEPVITVSPSFACHCPRALKVLATATVVGLLTGFLGVGGGFLVVPALVLAYGLPMAYAAGTSLVVITITSASALAVRAGTGMQPSWGLVALLTAVAVLGGWAGARLTARTDANKLQAAFTVLLLLVAGVHGLAGPACTYLTHRLLARATPPTQGEPLCAEQSPAGNAVRPRGLAAASTSACAGSSAAAEAPPDHTRPRGRWRLHGSVARARRCSRRKP